MSEPVESYLLRRQPTAARPLLGLTILLVEDSRYASEAIRLMCLRSGARIRRADCLESARKHLRTYRPSVAIVDLGLPDGSGTELIRELVEGATPVQAVLATSGDPDGQERAGEAGAMGFLEKPIRSISQFQQLILSFQPPEARPLGLRAMSEDTVIPDMIAYRDDMAHVAELMDSPMPEQPLDYIAQFVSGVARSAEDEPLEEAASLLSAHGQSEQDKTVAWQQLQDLVMTRLGDSTSI